MDGGLQGGAPREVWPRLPLGRACRRRTRCGCCGSRSARRNSASCSNACRTTTRAACRASPASPTTTSTGRRRRSGHVSERGLPRGLAPPQPACLLARPRRSLGNRFPDIRGQRAPGRSRLGGSSRQEFPLAAGVSSCGHSGHALSPLGSGALLCLHQRQQQYILVPEDNQRDPQFPLLRICNWLPGVL